METISIIIPAYNEELTIGKVIKDFKKQLPDANIYVYDNNSTDNTAKIAEEAGILPNHISKVLRELKETGMVECINEEARKRRLYRLTAVGEEVVEKLD